MFERLLGKSDEEIKEDKEHEVITHRVEKMNLVDMKAYVNNRMTGFDICTDGLTEVMKKINSKDDDEKRFVESDAMDAKKKKAFDLVIMIASNKLLSVVAIELIQEFIELYEDIILQYDTDYKEIYAEKLKKALSNAIATVEAKAALNNKMKVIGS